MIVAVKIGLKDRLLQIQLIRIECRVPEYGWTTQKVFHSLNFLVNGGMQFPPSSVNLLVLLEHLPTIIILTVVRFVLLLDCSEVGCLCLEEGRPTYKARGIY